MAHDRIRRAWSRLTRHPDWNIGVAHCAPWDFLDPARRIEVTWFPRQPRHQYIADPFAITRNGTRYVFFETFDFRSERGIIQCCALDEALVPGPIETALSLPHHLSYPFVFEYGDDVFMIPESHEAGEVSLYIATNFPSAWSKERCLIPNFAGLDCTLFQHGGKWWLAGTQYADPARYDLYLWYADDLFSDWLPHRGNPVKSCPRSARPGGKPFVFNEALYRPAQNCETTYGESLTLNRIVTLTPTDFSEEVATRVMPFSPGRYRHGLHTLCGAGDVTFIDGCGRKFVAAEASRILRQWLARRPEKQ